MVTDFVYFTIILNLFGVSFVHSLLLSLVTMCIRPAGEMIAVLCFDQMQSMYNNRNAFNGTVIALSVFVAYGMPLLKRQIRLAVFHSSGFCSGSTVYRCVFSVLFMGLSILQKNYAGGAAY